MKEIIIGTIDQFTSFPSEVQVEDNLYFLTEVEGIYTLLSSVCPHAGYTVDLEDGELVCPLHGWTYEVHTGRCHNVPSARLHSYVVILRDGTLLALID
ncbi:anthranilate 1,2-dioxygenase ferredoxin subunit [Paenibacillus sp. V4I3]|uniref:Rieske (2Fe-2S) protein n=1 Tax=Paenibacillus sp. V4I3 TaxID=3042305 RepID=UPI002786B111|nr:Rieske (2Fe-2S) protein [Paenibacillus sp. V4I3]MDQ0874178.1 anthranilate 1,2-dioxygenase ferredoxin subunit [Paenibacillus sp. V4I3]